MRHISDRGRCNFWWFAPPQQCQVAQQRQSTGAHGASNLKKWKSQNLCPAKMEAVAFLPDITSHLTDFNVKLQGRNNTVTPCLWCALFRGSWRCLNLTYRRACCTFQSFFEQTRGKKSPQFLEKLIENFQTSFEDLSLGKQVLLCIGNPFLVRNVTEFSIEGQRICPWVNTAALQTELIEFRENTFLQEAHCDPVTLWTAEDSPPHPHLVCFNILLRKSIFQWWIEWRTATDSLMNTSPPGHHTFSCVITMYFFFFFWYISHGT